MAHYNIVLLTYLLKGCTNAVFEVYAEYAVYCNCSLMQREVTEGRWGNCGSVVIHCVTEEEINVGKS